MPRGRSRPVRAAAGIDRAGDLGLGHAELRAAGSDGETGQRLGGDVRVQPVEHVERWCTDPFRFVGQCPSLLRRLDGDPPERLPIGRGARRGPEVGPGLADPLERRPVVRDPGPARLRPLPA